jgi:hypothetical protein
MSSSSGAFIDELSKLEAGAPPSARTPGPASRPPRDFGGVSLVAIPIFPGTRLDPPFDINLSTFRKVFAANFTEFTPGNNSVPLGALLFFTRILIFPLLGCGNVEICNRHTAGRVTNLGITPQPTN